MSRLASMNGAMLAIAIAASFPGTSASGFQAATKAPLPTKTDSAKSKAEDGLIDINSADQETLQTLPGIGPVLAKEIIAGRPYANITQLSKISGLGEAKLADLKGKIIARRATPAKEETPKAKAATKQEMTKEKAATKDEAPSGPIDINSANLDALQTLPGVGPVLAKAIIEARPFASVDDLSKVSGMGPAKLADLKGKVVARKDEPKAAPKEAMAKKAESKKAAVSKDDDEDEDETKKTSVPKLAPNEKVDLNSASLDKLDALPGIGPVKAQAIIDARPFKKIEDVMSVKGIKENTFSKMKDHIIIR